MKIKKFDKKLTLDKKTIAKLNLDEMKKINGGEYDQVNTASKWGYCC